MVPPRKHRCAAFSPQGAKKHLGRPGVFLAAARNLFLFLSLMLLAPLAAAELVVVANPQSGIERLTQEEVVNIYLGRYRRLASGVTAEPVDLGGDTLTRARFYRALVGKSLAEINAYWARLVFSGRTRPPHVAENVETALQYVAARSGALAYVERAQADRRVRVVFELSE
jgi:ABC-type phosphate transport system substrate-binding protein